MKSSNDKDRFENLLIIGEVAGVHGLRGVLKIRSYADSPALFEPDMRLQLETVDGQVRTCTVNWAKPHGKGVILEIDGVNDRDSAEALVGSRLRMDRTTLPDLEEGTYYWFELIGLRVYTMAGRYLGVLEAVVPTGSNDVYLVRDGDDEILVPALASVVQKIDKVQRRMEVILPDGL